MPRPTRVKIFRPLGPLGLAGVLRRRRGGSNGHGSGALLNGDNSGRASPPPSAAAAAAAELDRGPGVSFYLRVLSYFRPDAKRIGLLLGFIWVALAAGTLEVAVVAVLTDAVLSDRPPASPTAAWLLEQIGPDRGLRIVWLGVSWLLFRGVVDTCQLLREMINNRLRFEGTARVRRQLFDHLQTLTPAYHKSRPQGDAIYRLSTDALGFFGVLDTFVGAANSGLTVFVIGAVMAQFNGQITVVCLALTPLMVVANAYFSRTIRRTSAASKQADTDLTTFVQRAMATVALAQLFGRQRTESARFGTTVDHTIHQGMRMSWQQALFPWSQRVTYAAGHAFVLAYGGWLVYQGRLSGDPNALTVGGIGALTVALGQLWEPIRRMAGFTAEVQTNVAACGRVFAVLDLEPAVVDPPAADPLPVRRRPLELRGVAFSYDADRPVLSQFDARVGAGEMVAFVGPSGTGKSTLLNLLPRFYDPTGGAILLDGHDLRTLRLADVRGHVALVPQDSPVVAGTVADNIAFGRPGASAAEIARAAEQAGAAAFIADLPEGYQTLVTEAGQNLSGGQRQRLAIARALLTDAPILVLDEPTSGLDRHHERLVLETLYRLKGTRTIILVTHNLACVKSCDRIYVLGEGRVLEAGTHDELLARGGHYARSHLGVNVTGGEPEAYAAPVQEKAAG